MDKNGEENYQQVFQMPATLGQGALSDDRRPFRLPTEAIPPGLYEYRRRFLWLVQRHDILTEGKTMGNIVYLHVFKMPFTWKCPIRLTLLHSSTASAALRIVVQRLNIIIVIMAPTSLVLYESSPSAFSEWSSYLYSAVENEET